MECVADINFGSRGIAVEESPLETRDSEAGKSTLVDPFSSFFHLMSPCAVRMRGSPQASDNDDCSAEFIQASRDARPHARMSRRAGLA